MQFPYKPKWLITAAVVTIAALLTGLYFYRHRFVRSDQDMFSLLPDADATLCFVDVDKVRRAGMLSLLAGSKPMFEGDYKTFVEQTGFDYTADVDSAVAWISGDQFLLVVRGSFDWNRLTGYVAAHEGSCADEICRVASSHPGETISFTAIQSDVLGLALSRDASAVNLLKPHRGRMPLVHPADPAWIKLSPALLRDPASVPLPVRMFAISLQSAESVFVSLGPPAPGLRGLQLNLEAGCPNAAAAETMRNQLEIQTKMLVLEFARERRKPDRADLTGLLTGGTFQAIERRVLGTWPLHEELLKSLE